MTWLDRDIYIRRCPACRREFWTDWARWAPYCSRACALRGRAQRPSKEAKGDR